MSFSFICLTIFHMIFQSSLSEMILEIVTLKSDGNRIGVFISLRELLHKDHHYYNHNRKEKTFFWATSSWLTTQYVEILVILSFSISTTELIEERNHQWWFGWETCLQVMSILVSRSLSRWSERAVWLVNCPIFRLDLTFMISVIMSKSKLLQNNR